MALTVSNYMIQPFFGEDDLPKSASTLLAAVFICGLTWLNCYSMKVTTRLQNVFMVTKVVALMLVILVGIYALSQGTYLAWGTSINDVDSIGEGRGVTRKLIIVVNYW